MPSVAEFVAAMRRCELPESGGWEAVARGASDAEGLAGELVRAGFLTAYQARQLLSGRGPDLVLGPFLILDVLGAGGMGQVFKAKHRLMGRVVALKLMLPTLGEHADIVARFRQEVKSVSQLSSHPNVVTAFHADTGPRGLLLAMEYCDGRDLGQTVRDSGHMAVARACDCISQAAAGLNAAHAVGLVHRDIKPSNLFLTADGVVKILDFGLARFGHDDDTGRLTHTGASMGTPDFMAPEQARDSSAVDIRGDIYSLGCTLYYLLAGRVPFPGGTGWSKVVRHQSEYPEPIEVLRPQVPPELAAVVRKMMAKEAVDRYQTPAEVGAALAPFHVAPLPTTAALGGLPPTQHVIPRGAELPRVVGEVGSATVLSTAVAPSVPLDPFDFGETPAPSSDESVPTRAVAPTRPPGRRRRRAVWPVRAGAIVGVVLVAVVAAAALLPRKRPDDSVARNTESDKKSGGGTENPPQKSPPGPGPGLVPLPKGPVESLGNIPYFRIAVHPDGDLVALARGQDGSPIYGGVELRSVKDKKWVKVLAGGPTHPPVYAVAFSADGRYLAYGCGALNGDVLGARAVVYDTKTWDRLTEIQTESHGIRGLAFLPQPVEGQPRRPGDRFGTHLLIASYTYKDGNKIGGLEMWEGLREWRETTRRGGPIERDGIMTGVAVNPASGVGFAASCWDGTVHYWHPSLVKQDFQLDQKYKAPDPRAPFIDVAWSKGGHRLAAVTFGTAVPGPSRLVVWSAPGDPKSADPKSAEHGIALTSVALLPDGSAAVTGDDDGVIELWELSGDIAQPRACARRFNNSQFGLAVTPDGSIVIGAGHLLSGDFGVEFIPISEFGRK